MLFFIMSRLHYSSHPDILRIADTASPFVSFKARTAFFRSQLQCSITILMESVEIPVSLTSSVEASLTSSTFFSASTTFYYYY